MTHLVASSPVNIQEPSQVKRLLERPEIQQMLGDRIQGGVALELRSDSLDRGFVYKVESGSGVHIVRFPVNQEQEIAYQLEQSLTEYLKDRVSISIPDTVFYARSEKMPAMAVHTWVHGDPLTTEIYEKMTLEQRKKLVRDLTEFFLSVHKIDIEEAARVCRLVVPTELKGPEWFNAGVRSRVSLLPRETLGAKIHAELHDVLQAFEVLFVGSVDLVLAHGDVHGFNLAMSSDTEGPKLSGIFDFGCAGILDVNEEFFRLNFISPTLTRDVVTNYRDRAKETSAISPDIDRIDLYWKGFLLYLINISYVADDSKGVEQYRQFYEDFVDNRRAT